MSNVLFVLGSTGAVLIALYYLEAKGKVQLNHNALKIAFIGMLGVAGFFFITKLLTFV